MLSKDRYFMASVEKEARSFSLMVEMTETGVGFDTSKD